jgi:hypothetical protein
MPLQYLQATWYVSLIFRHATTPPPMHHADITKQVHRVQFSLTFGTQKYDQHVEAQDQPRCRSMSDCPAYLVITGIPLQHQATLLLDATRVMVVEDNLTIVTVPNTECSLFDSTRRGGQVRPG